MNRELGTFRAAAARIEADLRRTLEQRWSCTIDDRWVLVVSDGEQRGISALGHEVEDEDWYVRLDQTPEERASALDADADEAVATEVTEVLRVLDIQWPTCSEHTRSMMNCEGYWICNGPPTHDVALAGQLGMSA